MIQFESAAMFVVAIVAQVIAASVLPRTNGFSSPVWTMICIISNVIAFALIAILIRRGVGLAIIVPAFAAVVPLATIAVSYFGYGETVSIGKLALLVGACCAIALASAIN